MKFYGEQPVESNTAAELLRQIAHLMELNGDNVFKVRAFTKAADHLEGREDLKVIAQQGRLLEFEGVGKGIAEVLSEFLLNEKVPLRDSLISALPKGLLEIAELPGLGPKKLQAVREGVEACIGSGSESKSKTTKEDRGGCWLISARIWRRVWCGPGCLFCILRPTLSEISIELNYCWLKRRWKTTSISFSFRSTKLVAKGNSTRRVG